MIKCISDFGYFFQKELVRFFFLFSASQIVNNIKDFLYIATE